MSRIMLVGGGIASGARGSLRDWDKSIKTNGNVNITAFSAMSIFPSSTELDISVDAAVGDILEVTLMIDIQGGGGGQGIGFDIGIVDPTNSDALLKFMSSETSTARALGIGGGWYRATATQYDMLCSTMSIQLGAGDIKNNQVKVRPYAILASTATVILTASTSLPMRMIAKTYRSLS